VSLHVAAVVLDAEILPRAPDFEVGRAAVANIA
jgi:hypothetical protein